MAVTAKQLSKSGARGRELDLIVREHLQIIDDRLLHSERTWGRNTLIYDLPVIFALPGLDKRDAQRIVYSAIIRSLDRRGFETRILLEPDRTALCVAWMTDLDTEEVEAMSALIRAKRVSGPELEPFLARGAIPAPRAATAARAGVAAAAAPLRFVESGAEMRPRGGVAVANANANANADSIHGIGGGEAAGGSKIRVSENRISENGLTAAALAARHAREGQGGQNGQSSHGTARGHDTSSISSRGSKRP